MRQHNQEKQSVQNCSTENTSIELFQSISDEQAETIKGGWTPSMQQPVAGAGSLIPVFCEKTKQYKNVSLNNY